MSYFTMKNQNNSFGRSPRGESQLGSAPEEGFSGHEGRGSRGGHGRGRGNHDSDHEGRGGRSVEHGNREGRGGRGSRGNHDSGHKDHGSRGDRGGRDHQGRGGRDHEGRGRSGYGSRRGQSSAQGFDEPRPHGKKANPGAHRSERFGRGRGKGRGGRAGRGDLRTAVLLLLNEGPMHGYQIMTSISERTEDNWTPSPGAIYPTLSMLEDEGLISISQESGRKLATLTEAGQQILKDNEDEWKDFFQSYIRPADQQFEQDVERRGRGGRRGFPHGFSPELFESLGALRHALSQVDESNRDQALEIMNRAADEISHLLAADTAGDSATKAAQVGSNVSEDRTTDEA